MFTDHERLSPPQVRLARQLWATLSATVPPVRLVNDPHKMLGRLDFLRRLHAEGINSYRAVSASEPVDVLRSLRYPVFIREEKAHLGPLTQPLHRPDDVMPTLRRLRLRGYYRRDLMIVEFCDTADASGIYRKYSAFRIAGKIIPRHVLFSRSWNLKQPDLKDPSFDAEHDTYLKTNPHDSEIARIFDLGGFDYGRIDYSLLDGKLQVWEINSNPTVRHLTPRLTAGFEELDDIAPGQAITWSVSQKLDRALKWARRTRYLKGEHRRIAARMLGPAATK